MFEMFWISMMVIVPVTVSGYLRLRKIELEREKVRMGYLGEGKAGDPSRKIDLKRLQDRLENLETIVAPSDYEIEQRSQMKDGQIRALKAEIQRLYDRIEALEANKER